MGRLSLELRDRAEIFGNRMLDVVQALERKRVYARIIDQMVGCGTSVGANACEADQAMSGPDFCKALATVVKELGESQYWLRTCIRRSWLTTRRLGPLQEEATHLARIFSTMIVRTRKNAKKPK
jgi:four helix bundle protein